MKKRKLLHLSVSELPFEVMVTGEKKTEFRRESDWILSRLINKDYDFVKIVHGYGSYRPFFIAEYKGWEMAKEPETHVYSNGLHVDTELLPVKIHLGTIFWKENIEEREKCQKCEKSNGTKKLHACPFDIEINNCNEHNCNCCEKCTYECADGV